MQLLKYLNFSDLDYKLGQVRNVVGYVQCLKMNAHTFNMG